MNTHLFTLVLLAGIVTGMVNAQADLEGYKLIEEGNASWYGSEFAGRPTASGETFNPTDLTAAHNNLPFNTMVRVHNLANGKSVLVRINDRGPYKPGRIIDVSQAAADALGLTLVGVTRVRIETQGSLQRPVTTTSITTTTTTSINPNPVSSPNPVVQKQALVQQPPVAQQAPVVQQSPVAPSTPLVQQNPVVNNSIMMAETGVRTLQLVSYSVKTTADSLAASLVQGGFRAVVEVAPNNYYRVIIPGVPLADLDRQLALLGTVGFTEVLVRMK